MTQTAQKTTSKVRYAFGMFGTSIPINMIKTFAPIYYVDQLGITTRQFSTVLTFTALADIIFIYLLGRVSDRLVAKRGRRIWILAGTPILIVFFILFFNNEWLLASDGLFLYLLVLYLAIAILDGMININYGALFPEIFSKEKDRVVTNAYRQVFQLLAMMLSIAGTPILVAEYGYGNVAIMYGILALVVITYSILGCHEPKRIEVSNVQEVSNGEQLRTMLNQPLLWFYGAATLCYSVAFSLLTQGMPFYLEYTMEMDLSYNSYLLFSIFLTTIITIFAVRRFFLSVKIVDIWKFSFILLVVGFAILLFFQQLVGLFVGAIVLGAGIGLMMVSSDIIGTLVIDVDFERYKIIRTGLFMSFYNIMFRLQGVLVGLAFMLTETFYGFVNGQQTGDSPESAASFLFIYFPLAVTVIGAFFSQLFSKTLKK